MNTPVNIEALEHLSLEERAMLLRVARAAIDRGLASRQPPEVEVAAFPPALRELAATFVTLKLDGELRGCIGTLEARDPLILDVALHAYAAAFDDPRFLPVRRDEFERLDISVSVLTRPEPLKVSNQAELLEQLRPGRDGLILDYPGHRATFLPAVWKDLPDPLRFVRNLKRKAGLTESFWSPQLRFLRYGSESFDEHDFAPAA